MTAIRTILLIATTVVPLSPRPYRMELTGDSITCGCVNQLSVDDPDGHSNTTVNSNAYMAWGAIAARDLSAEYLVAAYSGRGAFRNYGGASAETLPEMYLNSLSAIVDPRAASGDAKLSVLDLGTQSAPYGEDWHPTIATHMDMAGALADLIDDIGLLE